MKLACSLFALVLTASLSGAAEPPKDASDLLSPIVSRHQVPGMAAVVIKGDVIIAQGAAGLRRIGSPEKITIKDKFHIGSDTKAITATLCAILVEKKTLAWNNTIADIPGLKNAVHPGFASATLEQMLTNS